MGLSVEAIVAVVGVVVGLPPTVLVLGRYLKRRGSRRGEEARGITYRLGPWLFTFRAQAYT